MDPATNLVLSGGKLALNFADTNDYVDIPWSGGTYGDHTLAFWAVIREFVNYNVLIDSQSSSRNQNDHWGIYTDSSGKLGSWFGSHILTSVLTADTQYHVAQVFEGSTLRWYINGVEDTVTTGLTKSNSGSVTTILRLGGRGVDYYNLNGQLDDINVYSRALNAGEIRTLAQRRGIRYETYRIPAWASTATENTTVTPSTASLTLTAYAPTVTTSANTTVTPATATLTLTVYGPTVTTPQLVTPSTASLTLAMFAPAVATHVLVTPATATLSLAAFAPVVATPVTVTPSTAALTTDTFAPSVSTPILVTPTNATLTTTVFTSTVTASADIVATPSTASLTLALFAPTVTAVGAVSVVPENAALALTTYAPNVTGIVTPTSLAAVALSSSSILVDWSHPGGATYFELERRVKAGV